MQEFSKQNLKMNLTEEAMDDALNDMFEGNEEEENAVVQQVLDDLGLDTLSKLDNAPNPATGILGGRLPVAASQDDDIESQLARLRAL